MVDCLPFIIDIAKQLQTQIIVHYVDMRKWTVEENHAPNVVLYGPNCEFQNFIIFAFAIVKINLVWEPILQANTTKPK